MDRNNIQTVLALKFEDFGLQPIRDGIAEPFFGRGINTTDGKFWEYSRSLVKPTFSRVEICNYETLETHLARVFEVIPRDGSSVDLQPLFSRLFLDTGTEFLFGKSADTLAPNATGEGEKFVESYNYVMVGFGLRVRLGRLRFLYRDKAWFNAVSMVHGYVDKYIDAAIEKHRKDTEKPATGNSDTKDYHQTRYILLDEMAKHTQDKADLRSQILAVFMPSRDTTSWLTSNTFHVLARNPKMYNKLRSEIALAAGTQPLTFELLKSIKYLQWALFESLRVYPVAAKIPRACLKDTMLPSGGGPNGDAPILMKKGDQVMMFPSILHKDKEFWGDNAEDFRPERWENLKPLWDFIPFGGGPRNCPAQQLVQTEAAYVIARIVQQYSGIERRDPQPWTETWHIHPLSKYGCQVALTPA